LVARQRKLLEALAEGVEALGGAERIHLVGYCLGGVDAHLATCERPLEAERWEEVCSPRTEAVRTRIASVVSIASPHLGMRLASAKGSAALTSRGMLRDPGGALYAARLVPKLLSSALSHVDSDDFWHGLAREGRKIAHFAAEVRRFRYLLRKLRPELMEQLHAESTPRPEVLRASVVVLTPPIQPTSETFFAELSKRAAGGSTMRFGTHDPVLFTARETITGAFADPARLIKSSHAELPARVEITTNDGMVNTCRQLMRPLDPSDLLAVVVADHFDVIGYYDRTEGAGGPERELLSGLLRSGSHFRDDEFFALYRSVGEHIATAASAAEARPETPTPERDDGLALEPALAAAPKTKRGRSAKARAPAP
jgi:hypothetical protein